jgi:hypothetical protein
MCHCSTCTCPAKPVARFVGGTLGGSSKVVEDGIPVFRNYAVEPLISRARTEAYTLSRVDETQFEVEEYERQGTNSDGTLRYVFKNPVFELRRRLKTAEDKLAAIRRIKP